MVQTREVSCSDSNAICDHTDRPIEHRLCGNITCGTWKTGNWSTVGILSQTHRHNLSEFVLYRIVARTNLKRVLIVLAVYPNMRRRNATQKCVVSGWPVVSSR